MKNRYFRVVILCPVCHRYRSDRYDHDCSPR